MMGCAASEPSLVCSLTKKQKELIRDVWSKIKEDKQKQEVGNYIYKSFLQSERELRHLFPKIVVDDGGERFTIDEAVLQHHASLVMDGIGFAVDCVDDLPKLQKFLMMLGGKHHGFGVPIFVVQKLWPALDLSFKLLLKDFYNKEARKAWAFFFSHMVNVMKTGMVEADMWTHQKKHE